MKTYREHELEYLEELESIQESIETLTPDCPDLQREFAPTVKKLRQREALIKLVLRKPTLPPLDDSLRNPLRLPLAPEVAKVCKEVEQMILDSLREDDDFWMWN